MSDLRDVAVDLQQKVEKWTCPEKNHQRGPGQWLRRVQLVTGSLSRSHFE